MKKIRCSIAIDGSNFYHKLKSLGFRHQINFDFGAFADFLVGDKKIVSKKYYVGAIRENPSEPKTKELLANQQRLLAKLKYQGFTYELGYLLKSDHRFHEKGVDVKMAVDMVAGSYKNSYDHFILVSSDSDLVPAVQEVRANKRTVEYVGFSNSVSIALIRNCSDVKTLKKEDLARFFDKNP